MKKIIFSFSLIVSLNIEVHANNSISDTTQNRYVEFGFKYNQLKYGSIHNFFSTYKNVRFGYSLHVHEFSIGYSPLKQAIIAETNHGYILDVYSIRAAGGYCKKINSPN